MRRVLKYGPLEVGVATVAYMPAGARIVHFSAQHGQQLYVWADVDDAESARGRHLLIVGTGWPVPEGGRHLGTWVSDDYVWHLFDGGSLGFTGEQTAVIDAAIRRRTR